MAFSEQPCGYNKIFKIIKSHILRIAGGMEC